MIERLEIYDYRSCIETKFDLQPDLSVLIGPNGSGKTNIMNAFLLLRSLATDSDAGYRGPSEATNESRLKVSFRNQEKKSILTAKIEIFTNKNNADVIRGSEHSWYAKEFTGNARRVNVPLWIAPELVEEEEYLKSVGYIRSIARKRFPRRYYTLRYNPMFELSESFRSALSDIAMFLRNIKYYSASQFTNPSLCPVSFEVEQEGEDRRAIQLRGHSRFLFDLYRAQNSTGYEQFFEVIGPDGINLIDKIEFKEIPTSSIDYTVRSGGKVQQRKREKILVIPQFKIGSNELSPSQLSEGTFKTITLLFYLMTEQSSALLIEEPEVCVHQGLLSTIVELIKTYSQQKQIIVSTHSDFVLDHVEHRHVYKVSRSPEMGTTVAPITKTMTSRELTALKHYLDTEGNLGEYWRDGGFD